MNGKTARMIRKIIYGEIYSPRHRVYEEDVQTGVITADMFRTNYQRAKKEWKNKEGRLWRNHG